MSDKLPLKTAKKLPGSLESWYFTVFSFIFLSNSRWEEIPLPGPFFHEIGENRGLKKNMRGLISLRSRGNNSDTSKI